ncbi:MAG: Na/Pi cotransporter family protein [Bacilli bacterium]|nr:Na/Pi cotransporter family protein [Bacilli bacterium]
MENLVLSIITLFVGAAVFIVGMNMMSSGLRKSTGRGLRKLLKRIRNNRLAGFGIGTTVTTLIQSSAATGVMVIGFIGAGAMTVFQGVSIILGAYVGTTVTGLLAALSSVKISEYFVILAVIGVILMFFKKELVKNIGEVLAGVGILFFGLATMSGAIKNNEDLINGIQTFVSSVNFPLLLLLIGAVVTALLQSSSASIGLTVAMVGSGAIQFQDAIYLVLGATIGTVITLLIQTIGGNVNVKRTGLIVLIIRVLAALVALAICWPLVGYIANGFNAVFGDTKEGHALSLAIFHIIYNVIFMLAALPFIGPVEKIANKFIKDKEEEKMKASLKFIDNHLLDTPTVAMMQVKREIINMMHLSYDNLILGYKRILYQDNSKDKELIETEDKIDYINNAITQFLINLTHNVSLKDEKTLGSFFHVVNDIERIGDHAYNFYESSLKMVDNDLAFSDIAKKEFDSMFDVICQMFDLTFVIFHDKSKESLKKLHDLEDQTDDLKNALSSAHYERIQKKTCKVENSPFYTTLVSELERVADHLVNIGYSIVNPTGDDPTEKLAEKYE